MDVLEEVRGIIVDIGETEGIKVVRVLSPDLVPINFGYHTSHYTHHAVALKSDMNKNRLPHYFA